MFDKIHVKNFKSLKDIKYDAVSLNVLMGVNAVGKSSFLQTLLLLNQISLMSTPTGELGLGVALNSEYFNIGTQADFFYCYDTAGGDAYIEYSATDENERIQKRKIVFPFDSKRSESDVVSIVVANLPRPQSPTEILEVALDFAKVKYLSANRLPPQQEHIFQSSKINNGQLGIGGENAVAFLAENSEAVLANKAVFHESCNDSSLEKQVNAWMTSISPGTNIHASKLQSINKALLRISFATGINQHAFRPQNVGFGISYTLPIIVLLLTAQPGDCILLENPEAHVHPRGQAELGRLIALCAQSGVQVFVETHSDHIMNGIRVAVKKGQIERRNVKIAFFTRCEQLDENGVYEQFAKLEEIFIDGNGELSDYPDGFMDEWNNQLMELI